jgi:hypothetical protein
VQEAEAYADYIRETVGEEEAAGLPPYRALPMQALDHAAGFLLAFGIAAALCKTVTVRVSLTQLPRADRRGLRAGRGLVARARVAQRDAPLDPAFRESAPADCVRRGPSAPAARGAAGPGGRRRLYDDRRRSGGLWAQGGGSRRTEDVDHKARGYVDGAWDT